MMVLQTMSGMMCIVYGVRFLFRYYQMKKFLIKQGRMVQYEIIYGITCD